MIEDAEINQMLSATCSFYLYISICKFVYYL